MIRENTSAFFVDEQITTSLLGYNDAIQTAVCAAQYDLSCRLEPIITVVVFMFCFINSLECVDKGEA